MKNPLFLTLAIGSFTIVNNLALIVIAQTPTAQKCDISAYSISTDKKGINVRAKPSLQSRIIHTLPSDKNNDVTVNIIASQQNWVEINQAEVRAVPRFKGKGWIYSPLLGTSTTGYATKGVKVYSQPNHSSKVLGKIPKDQLVTLLGCQGEYAKVKFKNLTGWIDKESQCPNPITTCP
jgi:SH3-like domain-containing protein